MKAGEYRLMRTPAPLALLLLLLAATPPAHAQSTLDKYLKKNTQGVAAGSKASEAGINKVYTGDGGFWRLDDSRATGGACAITWTAVPYYAGYLGPSGNTGDSFIVFSGPTIPPIATGKNRKMTLTAADGKAQTVDAFHAPNTAQKDGGIILFRLTDMAAAMADMSDVENITIGIDKKPVFSIKWQGGHTARAAMNKCLAASGQP